MGGRSPSPASEAAAPRRPRKRKSAEGALQENVAEPQLSGADGAQSDVKMQEVHERGAAVEVPRQSSGHAAKRAPKGDGYQFADVVSGQFDEDEANAEDAADRLGHGEFLRVPGPPPGCCNQRARYVTGGAP